MNAQQITQKVIKAIEDQDWDGAQALLAKDFTFSGAVPQPISGAEWLGVHRALAKAMPDLRFNYVAKSGNGDAAEGTVQLTGTNTGELALPMLGLPKAPATGRKITNPREPVRVKAQGDKLINWEVEYVADGGVPGILKQLGVAVPQP
jgi:hypothetical protein